ncbi:MAG TPA: hypothetical protein VFN71_01715 [Methylomirabilota bacterium]|nr:hypothetical protein [Methylomirabilota bacterium]
MREVLRSVVRRWLEGVLPLFALALLVVYFRPQFMPAVLGQNLAESLWPWVAWGMVGAMLGILGLSALVLAGFLVYSPFYLVSKSPLLLGGSGWVDRREVSFYISCFLLLCLIIFLLFWDWDAFVVAAALMAGFAPMLWRLLV